MEVLARRKEFAEQGEEFLGIVRFEAITAFLLASQTGAINLAAHRLTLSRRALFLNASNAIFRAALTSRW